MPSTLHSVLETVFTLNVGGYSGTGLINDAIYGAAHNHSGMKVSTKDNDNEVAIVDLI